MTPDTLPVAKLLYTPEEAARALGISRSKLYVLLARGDIESLQVGRSRRIRVTALDRFVDDLAAGRVDTP